MKISQSLLLEVINSWGDVNFQENQSEKSLLCLGVEDLENILFLADAAKNNCDYETANVVFAILLEVLFKTPSNLVVEYEHDDNQDDNYMHLMWLVLGEYRLNIPVPILKEEALERALHFENKRFLRTDHNRICSIFDYNNLLQHHKKLQDIFGEDLLLQACRNNLADNHQPDWL